MHAGEDLDQRRFARAVVADQRHDLAGMNVEVDVGQRRDGAEILGDAAQAKHGLTVGRWLARRISPYAFSPAPQVWRRYVRLPSV